MANPFSLDSLNYTYCPKCMAMLETKRIDGFQRLVCSSEGCDYIYWNNPTPIVSAIVEHQGKIILARNKGWPEDWFALIAGYLEACECPETGIKREINEELGLEVTELELIGLYPFERKNQLIIAYFAKTEGVVSINDELEEWRYYKPEEIEPWPEGTGQAVRDWLERISRR